MNYICSHGQHCKAKAIQRHVREQNKYCCPSYATKACHHTSRPSRSHTVPPESTPKARSKRRSTHLPNQTQYGSTLEQFWSELSKSKHGTLRLNLLPQILLQQQDTS